MKYKLIKTALFFLILNQLLYGCKLWGVRLKSNFTFTTLADQEKENINHQLTSFFHQSSGMADGWALLEYNQTLSDTVVPLFRSSNPATTDSALYWGNVNSMINNENGIIGIGHLRAATSGAEEIPNPHPWMFYDEEISYSLIHNGTINKNTLYNLLTHNNTDLTWLEMYEPQTFNGGDWRGDGWANVVDSELLLLFIMQQIDLSGGILPGLESALIKILDKGVYASQVNIIFSDGITLYIFGGDNGLYFRESEQYYSIMTTPENISGNSWEGLGGNELITFGLDSMTRYSNFISSESGGNSISNTIQFKLQPAYPNPFNGSVRFVLEGFSLDDINISILSLSGAIIDNFFVPKLINDKQTFTWAPRAHVPSGMYIISAKSNEQIRNRKILFIK